MDQLKLLDQIHVPGYDAFRMAAGQSNMFTPEVQNLCADVAARLNRRNIKAQVDQNKVRCLLPHPFPMHKPIKATLQLWQDDSGGITGKAVLGNKLAPFDFRGLRIDDAETIVERLIDVSERLF